MFHLLLAVIYLSFISLGLPDALLGAAWPVMYPVFGVPVSFAGVISMIIAAGTIVSSLLSDRMTRRFGTGRITAFSVATTAIALFGFSFSRSFPALCLWAIPYGLGAGSVDASLNNYVAIHYSSRHMSWLHCMWGLGAMLGPYVMSHALTGGYGWPMGYRWIGFLQVGLTVLLFLSLPIGGAAASSGKSSASPLSLPQILRIPGARAVMVAFFCYSAIETTAGLWASSYLFLHHGFSEEAAAGFASLFYLGMTIGRAVNGFLTIRFSDHQLIRLGSGVIAIGVACMLFPASSTASVGLVLVGLGCAPIYPCIIHSTPTLFGEEQSQAVIGVQMASAYVGTCLMPACFGLIANRLAVGLLPVYLLVFLVLMTLMHTRLCRQTAR